MLVNQWNGYGDKSKFLFWCNSEYMRIINGNETWQLSTNSFCERPQKLDLIPVSEPWSGFYKIGFRSTEDLELLSLTRF